MSAVLRPVPRAVLRADEPLRPAVRWPARLQLAARRDRETTCVHVTHEGPLRLLKTLHPEGRGIAHAVLVHPPGGLVGGDRLDVALDVDAGAHLLVTTPAASRFYRSTAGEAVQAVRARVGAGARLEWLPQETLAYDGCQGVNRWQVQLAPEAGLMAMEVLALGLAAAQRPFAHGRFAQHYEIEGLWRERGVIDAADRALLDGPCGLAGRRVLGTLLCAGGGAGGSSRDAGAGSTDAALEEALEDARQACGEAAGAGLLCGATRLHGRLLLLRLLGDEVEPAVRLLRAVRRVWRQRLWQLAGPEPRIWAS